MVTTFPDVEAIAATYLADHADLTPLVDGRVGTEVPKGATKPYLTVRRVGGRPPLLSSHRLDEAHLELMAWGEDPDAEPFARDEAFDVCAAALAAIHDLPGERDLGVVTDVRDILGPRPLYDPETSFPRYVAEVLVSVHPGAQGS